MHKDSADVRVERLREAVKLTIEDASYHLKKYRPHCLEALKAALATPSPAPAVAEGSGVAAIAAERQRQVAVEGWTANHDDEHCNGELAAAAAAYAFSAATAERYFAADPLGFWPWDASWWKPKSPRDDLVRAGALIAAEIDRLDRAAIRANGGEG